MTNERVLGGRSMEVGYVVCSGGLGANMVTTLGEVVLSDTISGITW
jgi:hypothetical protein